MRILLIAFRLFVCLLLLRIVNDDQIRHFFRGPSLPV
jgi:hypothetical protein